jgi:type 2 lantibiotic biosynthesis protein LanM
MEPQEFLQAAEELGTQVWECQRRATDGGIAWVRPGSETRGEPVSLQKKTDPFLYDGTSGIAFFLAALALATESPVWRDRSLRAVDPVREKLKQTVDNPDRASRLGVGGLLGLGSLIYSFVRIGTLTAEPRLIEEAHRLLVLMTPERIAADQACDVLSGSAGAILALLALYRSLPEPGPDGRSPLQTAQDCARNLIARQQSFDGRPPSWKSLPGQPPLGGFSHGAAGISYALLRLFQQTGETRLLESARQGLAFERTLYSPERRAWRDPKSSGEPRFAAGWCLGAAGESLARLAARDVLATPEACDELTQGLITTRTTPLDEVDHLCCGVIGRAEVLLRASEGLKDENLRQDAETLAWQSLLRMFETGSFRWRRQDRTAFDPTFFTGASGVGYTLLRLALPGRLPCVLALD